MCMCFTVSIPLPFSYVEDIPRILEIPGIYIIDFVYAIHI